MRYMLSMPLNLNRIYYSVILNIDAFVAKTKKIPRSQNENTFHTNINLCKLFIPLIFRQGIYIFHLFPFFFATTSIQYNVSKKAEKWKWMTLQYMCEPCFFLHYKHKERRRKQNDPFHVSSFSIEISFWCLIYLYI